ncbi:MAG: patatin-like phospholipase family protein [Verrucomicrobiota bacterium]|nr:patatin-like phospholipase family protein [Verrucomicrobiota bacterium]
MAQQLPQPNPSLPLHAVLEEEFAQLHGDLPPGPDAQSPDERLEAYWAAVHALEEPQAALCLSGGGIRSATFALGILQGLARSAVLPKFHYISTVSGGGYIAGWLSAWINNEEQGLTEVADKLSQPRHHTRPNPEPEQIQNLRSYSNYLSPRLGLFSADTWTLVGIYLRNLILNWFVLIPLLAALLTVPWFYTAILMTPVPPYSLGPLIAGGIFAAIAVAYMGLNLPCGGNKRWSQGSFLVFCLLPMLLAAILITNHWAWWCFYARPLPAWRFFGMSQARAELPFIAFGIVMHLLSWANSLLRAHGFRPKEFIAVVASGGVGGWLLWLGATRIFTQPTAVGELYTCFAVPLFLSFFFLAIMVFAGISSRWTSDSDREWWGRATGWFLVLAAGWILISGLVVFGPLFLQWGTSLASTLTLGAISGLLTIIASRSHSIPANEKQKEKAGPIALLLSKATSIAAIVFVVVLMIFITQGTTIAVKYLGNLLKVPWNLDDVSNLIGRKVEYLNVILYTPLWLIAAVAVGLTLFTLAMANLINTNKFSLHATYRDRLIRAYLGASNKNRDPNPFTGFDEHDNKAMRAVWDPARFSNRLFPVINVALNLVAGTKLAWQQRKAANFTISPLHCGSYEVGYRKLNAAAGQRYGGELSLGTAMTISGAAASPNMGYHSSPFVTFILTLLNVRLGAWLGNPGPAGDRTFGLSYPNFSVRPIVAEAFGLTNATNPYVYLSDGGHFENLGLYEMVLRRSHFIVVSDASQDPECSFTDLGDAVRKIRIDLGVLIEFDEMRIYGRSEEHPGQAPGCHAALGRIVYSRVDGAGAPDGVIVYIKPACYGNEPRDIYEYFKSNESFPHESTTDQFFSESQFESYRMLGLHTMSLLCPDRVADLPAFIDAVQRHVTPATPGG